MLLNKILHVLQLVLRITGIGLVMVILIGFIGLKINWKWYYLEQDATIPSSVVTIYPSNRPQPTTVKIQTEVKSIFDETIQEPNTDNTFNSFVDYFTKVNSLIDDDNWDGTDSDQIIIKTTQFAPEELTAYKLWLDKEKLNKNIPEDLLSTYQIQNPLMEIIPIVQSAQSDYIKYLNAIGVNSEYIEELQNNTLTLNNSRISYVVSNRFADPESGVDFIKDERGVVVNDDYSKLIMVFYSNDIYRVAKLIKDSYIIDPEALVTLINSEKEFRDMALRYTTFKLMTYGLQRAVDTINSPEKYKTDKDSHLKAIKSMSFITNPYELEWGGVIYNQINNRNIILRRQANYIAFEVFNSVYDLSEEQRRALFIENYERYQNLGESLRSQIESFNNKYPKYPIDNLRSKLLSDFIARIDPRDINKPTFTDVNAYFSKITNFVADYTYLNDQEISDLWLYIKN